MSERLVVIGGDAAGMSAASQARRRRTPDDLAIVAFESGNYTSYAACGIPYFVGDVVGDSESLIARSPEAFRDKLSIDAQLRQHVTQIDVDRGAVRVHDLAGGGERWEGFDQLVVATGALPARPPIPGVDAAGIYGVQILDDGLAVRHTLDDDRPQTAVVVGAGYIGLEMAEALAQRGLQVSLVEQSSQPMSTLDPDMVSLLADAMQQTGIALYLEEPVVGFETDDGHGGHVQAVVTEARTLPADLVVLGLGVRPNADLAQAAGIPTGTTTGAIVTDRRMRTGVDGIWAVGDCVETFHRVSRSGVHIALGTHANKQGRVAGINVGGGYATFPGVLGTAVTKICGIEVARTGLGEREAEQAGFAYQATVVDSTTRAGYFPGAAPIKTKLIAEERSGKLLGAQIVGEENSAKRIDALAVALWNEMTVEEMSGLDLSYAPPFAPVWDPVLIAARKAAERIERSAVSSE
jgi:NADPH-dependent 2,4-dienoyl-CoA reductase/sulfur reductase-like enzyme